MRRLMLRLRRRLADQRGAVAIVVAVAMVAVLGAAAVSIDVSRLYAERAQLQNGADAAAMAVAQTCAVTTCTSATATAIATQYANANANDGAANATVDLSVPDRVRVRATTRDAATGAGSLALMFAPVLGIDSSTVAASARASWGVPAAGSAGLALAFAPCVFNLSGTIQVINIQGEASTCGTSPSDATKPLPGGFGWLKDTAGTCTAKVDVKTHAPVTSDTGVSLPPGCAANLLKLKGKTVLLPVFSDVGGTGSSGWYAIKGWAAFEVLGWNFPGNSYNNDLYTGARCKGSCKGLIGKFITFVSLDDTFTTGTATPLGASIVTLSD